MAMRATVAPWNKPWAMVEIASSIDEGERVELIRAAYRSSRSGLITLALRGVSRQSVDRALDDLVDARTQRSAGVIYLDATELREEVITAATCASFIVASTDTFRMELKQRGINALGLEDGTRLLTQSATAEACRPEDRIA